MYGLRRTTEPAVLAVALGDLKGHLRVAHSDDDSRLAETYAPAAVAEVENYTNRQLINATWEFSIASFPSSGDPICVPVAPFVSLTSISYVDSDGDAAAIATGSVRTDAGREPAMIRPLHGEAWPASREGEPVVLTYVAGYGTTAESIPADLTKAIWMIVERDYDPPERQVELNAIERAIRSLMESNTYGDAFQEYAA